MPMTGFRWAVGFALKTGSLAGLALACIAGGLEQAKASASARECQDPIPTGSRGEDRGAAAASGEVRTVSFGVVDASTRRPVQGVTLKVWIDGKVRREHVTDETGRMVIALPRERFHLFLVTARRDGLAPMRVYLRRPTAPDLAIPPSYSLVLSRSTAIGGIIQDEKRRPIEGVTVTAQETNRRDGAREALDLSDVSARTDSRGRWHIDADPGRVRPGPSAIHVLAPASIPARAQRRGCRRSRHPRNSAIRVA